MLLILTKGKSQCFSSWVELTTRISAQEIFQALYNYYCRIILDDSCELCAVLGLNRPSAKQVPIPCNFFSQNHIFIRMKKSMKLEKVPEL